jgi:hypothetical protein
LAGLLKKPGVDFEHEGIETQSPLAQKLWQASKILGEHTTGGPFSKPLIEYSVQQLDFVLEMAAKDDPDKWTFVRPTAAPAHSVRMSGWNDVLSGSALHRFMTATGMLNALSGITAWRARQPNVVTGKGLRLGHTRGGKALKNAGDKN